MFVAAVHVYIKPEAVEEFKAGIKANHEGSIAEPGCLRFDVAQSREDPTEFLLWEVYLDDEAAAFHKTTPHYLAFKAKMPELMAKARRGYKFVGLYVNSDKLP